MTDRGVRVVTLAALALLAAFSWQRVSPGGSITHFLPSGREAELAALARHMLESELSRSMVLRVSGDGDHRAAAAALADALAAHPEVAWVQGPDDDAAAEALFRVYFPRRLHLASATPEREIPSWLTPDALRARAEALRLGLAGPASPLLARQAPADPLGLFARIVERAERVRPRPVPGASHVHLRTRASAFAHEPQARLLEDIEARFAEVAAAHGDGLRLEQGGVNRFAVAAERSIRRDVRWISAASVAGVVLLFLLFFRSLRSLALALLPASCGVAAATALFGGLLGPLHGVTLGFGLTLVGVAIDYPIHAITHHALGPPGAAPRATLGRVRGALLLGGGTTALIFAVLGASPFPGVDDMGRFAATGVLVALAVTLFCLPAFLPADGARLSTATLRRVARGLGRAIAGLGRRPQLALLVPALLGAVTVAGLPRVAWQDDPAALSAPDPALVAEDRRVRGGAAGVDGERFVVALGATAEAALQANDAVHARLADAVAAGHLAGFRSLHAVLWSEALQRRNLEAFRRDPALAGRVERIFAEVGFRPGAFAPFAHALQTPPAAPLRPADLDGTPLAGFRDATLVPLPEGWAALTWLGEVARPEALAAAVSTLDGVHYLDQGALLREIFAGYRRATLGLVALASGAVLLLLWVRYRRLALALLALLPSAGVALATLGLLALLGVAWNLLSVVGLLLVMGLGADYGVFAIEAARQPARREPTALGLLVSCITTLLVFGTLALSEHPALQSIGRVTGLGISLAFLCTPAVLALAMPRDDP